VESRSAVRRTCLNLLENAAKHHDRESGHLRVTAAEAGAWWELAVEDDGPGIPSQFHGRVFDVFHTLHRRDEREATGIGLALVRRIVLSIGGTVRLESPVHRGRGTCFRFTWPGDWPLTTER
jgi:signal transduction histidine kinase